MIAEAIEKLVTLGQRSLLPAARLIVLDENQFFVNNAGELQQAPFLKVARPSQFQVRTLKGLAVALVENRDRLSLDTFMVLCGAEDVEVFGPLEGETRTRFSYFEASSTDYTDGFTERFMDQKEFVRGVQTFFEDSDNRAQLLKVVGHIKDAAAVETQDDGVSQSVQTKGGVTLTGPLELLPSPLSLNPHRSFPELGSDRVPSNYAVRIERKQKHDGPVVEIGLFLADGGQWRPRQASVVASYLIDLLEHLGGCPVLVTT